MKDIDIHKGLFSQPVRDFLSQSMVDAEVRQAKNQKVGIPVDDKNPFHWAKLDALAQIDYLQEYVNIINAKEAIWLLIKNKGWQEWDVSDYVDKTHSAYYCMSFIGTEAEYKAFMKQFGG